MLKYAPASTFVTLMLYLVYLNNSDYDLLSYYTIQDDGFVPVLRNNALPLPSV